MGKRMFDGVIVDHASWRTVDNAKAEQAYNTRRCKVPAAGRAACSARSLRQADAHGAPQSAGRLLPPRGRS